MVTIIITMKKTIQGNKIIEFNNLLNKYKKYAKKEGFRLNPNEQIVKSLILAFIKRKKLKGEHYCPCRRIIGNKEEDKKIICPCIYHKEEILEQGHCLCHLFFK